MYEKIVKIDRLLATEKLNLVTNEANVQKTYNKYRISNVFGITNERAHANSNKK